MTSKQLIRSALELAQQWCLRLAEDLADAPFHQAAPGLNHAYWVIGHLANAEAHLTAMVTGEPHARPELDKHFGGRTQPQPESAYAGGPSYRELVALVAEGRRRTLQMLEALPEAELDRVPKGRPDEMKDLPMFASVGNALMFLAIHQQSHFGQLADARKSLGRAPLFF